VVDARRYLLEEEPEEAAGRHVADRLLHVLAEVPLDGGDGFGPGFLAQLDGHGMDCAVAGKVTGTAAESSDPPDVAVARCGALVEQIEKMLLQILLADELRNHESGRCPFSIGPDN